MVLRQYSSNQPYLLITVPVVAVAVLLPAASKGLLKTIDQGFPLDNALAPLYSMPYPVAFLAIILLSLGAIQANAVFNRHGFFNCPSFIPALLYVITGTAFCLNGISFPQLTSNLLVLIGLNRLLQVYRQPQVLNEYFLAGFYFGLAALSFPPFLLLSAGLWICVLFTRAFNWRELLIPSLAFSIPFLYWLVWKFWFRATGDMVLFNRVLTFDRQEDFFNQDPGKKVFLIAATITFLVAFPRFLFFNHRNSNKARNVKAIFFIFSLSAIASAIAGYFLTGLWNESIIVVPLSFIAGFWFSNYRVSLIAPFVFYAMIGCFFFVLVTFFG
ncbi:MAG: hypothetical protein IT223_07980 [Crocinitomicaceae bacterium]|nr:hypothetical protein [Crocinitomicaceae bacterium]